MRVTQHWAFLAAVLLAFTICSSRADEEPSWGSSSWSSSVKESMLARRSAEAEAKQEDIQGRNYAVHEQIYSNETEVNELIEQLITSRREGRILNDYDQVYADGNVDQALMQGDDMQARNIVRDKLCSLGLMSCEAEGKRPYYSNIYAQGPPPPPGHKFGGGPYGPAKPMPPPGFYNGRPPMGPPPSSVNSFGPPRKVGYESSYKPGYRPSGPGGNYNGPYLESPPPSAIDGSGLTTFNKPPPGAIIYGSKPPGPVYNGNGAGPNGNVPPYAFENPDKIHAAGSQQTNFYSHQSSASASQSSSTKVVVGGTVANAVSTAASAGLQQHVHHHFHHVDGGDSAKVPTVPVPLGNGQTINTDFSALAQSSTAFNPQTSGASSSFGQSQNSYNAGFNAASQGGLLSQTSNGFKPNGLGSSNGFGAGSNGFGSSGASNGFGSTGFGSAGSSSGFNSGSNFGSASTGFGAGGSNTGFGSSSSSSYHSQNPNYYKKELHNLGGIQSSSSNNFNSLTSGYDQSSYNNAAGGYDTSRNQYVDCQCVPFNQCPAADRIGRKEDLILAIDPRNLGKEIEALSDEAAANITTNAMPEKKEQEDDKKQDEGEKKRSKREADQAKDKEDEAADLPLDAEG
ncbi:uncharacterized protein LOC133329519, partial [Musca vetustissima]|uniref:uncharacterized protein LOC133329519 n=1 Tax=Musca vetustissima TaxID=27455 RepID=UPI002AB6D7F1